MNTLITILYCIFSIVNFVVGFIVLLNNKQRKQNIVFFLLILILNGWILSNLVNMTFRSYDVSHLAGRISFFFGALIIPAFIFFVYYFPKKSNYKTYVNTLIAIPGIILAIFSFSGLFIADTIITDEGLNLLVVGDFHYIYSLLVGGYVMVYLFLFYKKYKTQNPIEKNKLKYVFVGFVIASAIGIFFDLIMQPLYDKTSIGAFGSLGTIFISITVTYAILRYRFLDIKLVLKRSFLRLVSLAIIFGVYLFVILSLKDSINLQTQSEQTTFLVIATLVVVITIEPIRKFIHRIVDKAFESSDKKHEEVQKKIKLTLRTQQTVENLQTSMIKITQDLFEVTSAEFLDKSDSFLRDNKEVYQYLKSTGKIIISEELPYRFEEEERFFFIHDELEKTNYSSLIPLGQNDIFMGCLVLGKRKNHAAYTVEEVREMKHLQDQFTEALWNARLYQQAIARIKI